MKMNNKSNLIIGLFAVVILMGIGFAAFTQNLKIEETSSVTNSWNVYISDAKVLSTTTGATGNVTTQDNTTATFTTDLKYPGDKVVYQITVKNGGNVEAYLADLSLKGSNSDSVVTYNYDSVAIPKGSTLAAGSSVTFTVTVAYDSTQTGTAKESQKSNTGTLTLDYAQK
jgi:hypothetical protein